MKRLLATGFMVIAASLFAVGASAVTVSDYNIGDAANGIASSRHNLGSLGRVLTSTSTTEICIFCHTPHHANTSGGAPLWNRSTAAATNDTAYGTTLAGTTVADSDLGSATLACLSCHDGITTFDNLVNRPGKDTVSGDQGWLFQMPIPQFFLPHAGVDRFDASTAGSCYACHGHNANDLSGQVERFIIGPELSNDHPVSVPYTEGTASLRVSSSRISQIDLSSDLGSTNTNVMQNLWAVKGYFNTDATIGDLLRDNPNAGGKTVECSSCHDPHFRNLSWDEAESTWVDPSINVTTWCNDIPENCSDGMFLRRVGGNTGSGLCRTCHNK